MCSETLIKHRDRLLPRPCGLYVTLFWGSNKQHIVCLIIVKPTKSSRNVECFNVKIFEKKLVEEGACFVFWGNDSSEVQQLLSVKGRN